MFATLRSEVIRNRCASLWYEVCRLCPIRNIISHLDDTSTMQYAGYDFKLQWEVSSFLFVVCCLCSLYSPSYTGL